MQKMKDYLYRNGYNSISYYWYCSSCGAQNNDWCWSCVACGANKYQVSQSTKFDFVEYFKKLIKPAEPELPQGWGCPRCKKVNAPDVKQCGCDPDKAMMVNENGEWVKEEV
jgi:rubredoxin